MDIEKADVRGLLENEEFIGDVTKAIIEDPDIMEELVEDVADELEGLIEDDPKIGRGIIEAAMAGEDPKGKEGGEKMEKIEEIKGVGARTARKLRRGGYETIQQVAETSVTDLKKLGIPETVAGLIINSAREMIEELGVTPKKVPVEEMQIKQRILSAAMGNPHFRKKVVAYLVKEMR